MLVAEEGFEPSQTESESVVLPLHNSAISAAQPHVLSEATCIIIPNFKEKSTLFSKIIEKVYISASVDF